MRPWVLDASALTGALLDPPRHGAVLNLLADEDAEVVVPHVCDVEILSVFQRLVRSGEVEADRARQALDLYRDLPLRRFDHTPLLERAFALRDDFSAYDAVYIALAEGLVAPLMTADARLARAVRAWTGVEVVEVAQGGSGAVHEGGLASLAGGWEGSDDLAELAGARRG